MMCAGSNGFEWLFTADMCALLVCVYVSVRQDRTERDMMCVDTGLVSWCWHTDKPLKLTTINRTFVLVQMSVDV